MEIENGMIESIKKQELYRKVTETLWANLYMSVKQYLESEKLASPFVSNQLHCSAISFSNQFNWVYIS